MSNSKFASIAKILQEYDFNNETENNKDLTCVICHRLLNNAYNGPCGCRYCLGCIKGNIGNGEDVCPGKFEDCKDQKLKLDENVLIDQAANTRISRLVVKCPEIDCEFEDELRKIEDHFRVCDVKPRNCPYFDFGCTHLKIAYNKMSEHLANESYSHAILMLDWMQNLKNEVASVEEKFEHFRPIKTELQAVKQELAINKIAIIEMQEKMNRIIIRQKEAIGDNSDSDGSTNPSSIYPNIYLIPFERGRPRGRSANRMDPRVRKLGGFYRGSSD